MDTQDPELTCDYCRQNFTFIPLQDPAPGFGRVLKILVLTINLKYTLINGELRGGYSFLWFAKWNDRRNDLGVATTRAEFRVFGDPSCFNILWDDRLLHMPTDYTTPREMHEHPGSYPGAFP